MQISNFLTSLSHKRPLFHSEADFQHALAWEIQLNHPEAKVRLEYRPTVVGEKMYVDLWVILPNGSITAVELKYKTRSFVTEFNGEEYQLLNQGAQDLGRYDFLRDVVRLEQLTALSPSVKGAAVLLTNDRTYWSPARSPDTVDGAFRIHEGRSLAGELAWGAGASEGTMRARESPIALAAAYSMAWTAYSKLDAKEGEFRYALLDIAAGRISTASEPV